MFPCPGPALRLVAQGRGVLARLNSLLVALPSLLPSDFGAEGLLHTAFRLFSLALFEASCRRRAQKVTRPNRRDKEAQGPCPAVLPRQTARKGNTGNRDCCSRSESWEGRETLAAVLRQRNVMPSGGRQSLVVKVRGGFGVPPTARRSEQALTTPHIQGVQRDLRVNSFLW